MSDDFAKQLTRMLGAALIPSHVIQRLEAVTSPEDVAYLDCIVEKGLGRIDGEIVAITNSHKLIRLTLTEAKDEAVWENHGCTLRVESLRGRVKVMEINRPDGAWSYQAEIDAGAVRLELVDPHGELTLPLTRQRDARAFLNGLSALID